LTSGCPADKVVNWKGDVSMAEKRFNMGEEIRFAWEIVKENIGFFILLLIVAFFIENLPGIISGVTKQNFPVVSFVLGIAGWIIGMVVQMGMIKVSLKFCDGEKGKLDDLLSSFSLVLPFLAASILYTLIVMAGFILLIVPGVILGIKFSLFPYFIVDERLGPIEALKASASATSGAKIDLFLFGFLIGLINIGGAMALLIGLFVTIPVSMVAYASVYRKLAGKDSTPQKNTGGVMYINLEPRAQE
jgi:hypothetical protein